MDSIKIEQQKCLQISIEGCVQGVGFRPFIYRLAQQMNLKGWVGNSSKGVILEVQGPENALEDFLIKTQKEHPIYSFIQNLDYRFIDPKEFSEFTIHESELSLNKTAPVLPDIATCPECLNEIFDPDNRRYLYPFTNCTHCGPRYSIIEALPYDRPNTSMKNFSMCSECQQEYGDPSNRRFHAQPNACPQCGPQMELWSQDGIKMEPSNQSLLKAAEAINKGHIVAIKSIGGFHLCVDAANEQSVAQLRKKKHREAKPLAVIFPSLDLIKQYCHVSRQEEKLVTSAEAPIVLLLKKSTNDLAPSIAPDNPYLGVMLPYSPLHHILMRKLQKPMVATSGNLTDEPICIDEKLALKRLWGIADVFLVHNRPIVRAIDDSVTRTIMDRPLMLRRSRGYAPLPVVIEKSTNILALGGHLKNTIALCVDNNIFVSQHIGDLETKNSFQSFQHTKESLINLYEPSITHVVSDKHPDYYSSQFARQLDLPVIEVQHHHAHIVSCMAENNLDGEVLGIVWDGTGWGEDETIWGGEFLLSTRSDFQRVGHLRSFKLPGGEKAIREPRRSAFGLLMKLSNGDLKPFSSSPTLQEFQAEELQIMKQMFIKELNTPETTSMGRLFDAAASLLGVCQVSCFEGQAAMLLEYLAQGTHCVIDDTFLIMENNSDDFEVDWGPIILAMLEEIRQKKDVAYLSAKFHNTLVEMAVKVAKRVNQKHIVLSGGCFQNKYLTERLIYRLRKENFIPYWHQWIPPNDGGIALGQAVVGGNLIKKCV